MTDSNARFQEYSAKVGEGLVPVSISTGLSFLYLSCDPTNPLLDGTMAKDSYWFKHDNNARNDEKILELRAKLGAEGYGIYWMIVETMAEDEHGFISFKNIGGLSLGYGVAIGRLSEIIGVAIEVELFHEKDGKIFSNRMLRQKDERKNLAEYGKKGAENRWGGHRGANGVAMADPMADKIRREKKRKDKRGVRFSDDGASVIFEDDSSQPLGPSQQQFLKEGGYEPFRIIKGKIE